MYADDIERERAVVADGSDVVATRFNAALRLAERARAALGPERASERHDVRLARALAASLIDQLGELERGAKRGLRSP